MSFKALVVDDEESVREFCAEALASLNIEAWVAESATPALAMLESRQIDIVLADVRMPGTSGLEFLKVIRRNYPQTAVVIMTAYGSIPAAVQAIKLGAHDYITKPFKVDDLNIWSNGLWRSKS